MKNQKIRIKIDSNQIIASVSAALAAQFEGQGEELELEITEDLLKDRVQLAMDQQIHTQVREVLDRQRMTIRRAIETLITNNLGAMITPDVVKKHVQAYVADQVRYDLPKGAKAQIKAHIAKLFTPGANK